MRIEENYNDQTVREEDAFDIFQVPKSLQKKVKEPINEIGFETADLVQPVRIEIKSKVKVRSYENETLPLAQIVLQ
jgi:hypothetical protein